MIYRGNTVQALSRKFTVALITTFLFSFALSVVNFVTATENKLSFSTLLLTFIVLSAPMFLLVGVLTSFVFEKFIRSLKMKWFSYIVVGATFSMPYALYLFEGADLFLYSIFGAIGAALFCGIHIILDKYLFKI